MPAATKINITDKSNFDERIMVIFTGKNGQLGDIGQKLDVKAENSISRAMKRLEFSGKAKEKFELIAPIGLENSRILVFGIDGLDTDSASDPWTMFGGRVYAALKQRKAKNVTIFTEAIGEVSPSLENWANFIGGLKLRAYNFEIYKKLDEQTNSDNENILECTIFHHDPNGLSQNFNDIEAVTEGVHLARDLINEPTNILTTEEFKNRASQLAEFGVKMKILDKAQMTEIGMGALLGVAQGSDMPPYAVIMEYMNGAEDEQPVVLVGKGVVFDTGGISLKPPASMEDMKADMGGAAAVTGAMRAIAGRQAKANVVGVIGLVENMPDSKSQRPGDIVKSLSGQTIEIINTDAEGRLVLCDLLTYMQREYKPKAMINLATLTGAIIIALGKEYAGLFSNNDDLSNQLFKAGINVEEKLWRMPLSKAYDKKIDSKFADVKNSGGREAGSITAAQFLLRFVNSTPWAHIDIAGVSIGSPATDIHSGFTNGFGVRLLNQYIRENHEN